MKGAHQGDTGNLGKVFGYMLGVLMWFAFMLVFAYPGGWIIGIAFGLFMAGFRDGR